MRNAIRQQLTPCSSITMRIKTVTGSNVSRVTHPSKQIYNNKSCTTTRSSFSSCGINSTSASAVDHHLPHQSQRTDHSIATASRHSMSTFSQSFGEYDATESIAERVSIALHHRQGQQSSRLQQQLRNRNKNPRSLNPFPTADDIRAFAAPTTITTTTTTTPTSPPVAIDPALQNIRLGKKNIHKVIAKLTSDYPLGSVPSPLLDLSLLAIDYCIAHNQHESNIGLHNAIKLIFWLVSERNAGNTNVDFNVDHILNPILNEGRRRSRPEEFFPVAMELLVGLEHLMDSTIANSHDNDDVLPSTMMPNIKTYNMVMDTISKSKLPEAPSLIRGILSRMEQQQIDNNYHPITPDTISYNTLLYAFSQSTHPQAAHECEASLRTFLPHNNVDTISYNIAMHAWNRSTDRYAAQRAEALLREMQERYNDEVEGSSSSSIGEHCCPLPNCVSFTTVINAWGKSRELDAAERAGELLQLMQDLTDQGIPNLSPNILTFNAVLNAWAKSPLPHAARRAESLLNDMIHRTTNNNINNEIGGAATTIVVPEMISFSICIKAWAASDERGASTHALALLKRMSELDGDGWFRTRPDVGTFNSVLRALANDSDPKNKAWKAKEVLEQMEGWGREPDLQTFNNVLRCCCTTRSDGDVGVRRDAVRLATQTLLRLRKEWERSGSGGIGPDPYTFNFFIKVCDRLCNDEDYTGGSGGSGAETEKLKLIKAAFQFCIETGQFSNPVLSILKNTLGQEALKNVLRMKDDGHQSLQNLKISDFPVEWSNRRGSKNSTKTSLSTSRQRMHHQRRDIKRLR